MTSLQRDIRELHRLVDDLLVTVSAIDNLDLRFQRLIAETAMLRLFYSLEGAVESISYKLLMSTAYCDVPATLPRLLQAPFRSLHSAETALIAASGKRYVKWSTLRDVQNNLSPFLDAADHFLIERRTLDPVFEDMRCVRNHIAHGTRSTRIQFARVVRRVYPLHPKGISPGKFLLSKRIAFNGAPGGGRMSAIEQYLRWTRVAVKSLVKA